MIQESEYDIFQGSEKICITPEIEIIFKNIINIEGDIKDMLSQKNRIEKLKLSYQELLNYCGDLVKICEENNLTGEIDFPESIKFAIEAKGRDTPMRSYGIVIFAYLEVLFMYYLAYSEQTSDSMVLLIFSHNKRLFSNFIGKFVLNDVNKYYRSNVDKFSNGKLSYKKLRKLRNSLTHFFCVPQIIGFGKKDVSNKYEKVYEALRAEGIHDYIILSDVDLWGLVQGSARAMIEYRMGECQDNNNKFNDSMRHLRDMVEAHGAREAKNNEI